MHRRQFLRATALLAGAAAAPPLLARASDTPHSALRIPHSPRPLPTAPTRDSITIVWPVATLATGRVEYGPTPALGKTAEGSLDGLRPLSDDALAIRIPGLRPGERIHMRTVTIPVEFPSHYAITRGDPVLSPIFEYTHPAETGAARVAVWNDTHQQAATIAALNRATAAFFSTTPTDTRPPPASGIPHSEFCTPHSTDLLVLNGDLVHDQFNTTREISETFFTLDAPPPPGASQPAHLIPHVFIRGNHDARGRHARDLHRFAPRPAPDGYHSLHRVGPIGIINLDTGDDKERPDVYGGLGDFAAYREQQKRWLAAALADPAFATAPYRVVFCHIPLAWKHPARRGDWCPDGDARWSPLLAAANIHAVISGHTHEFWHDAPRAGRPWHQIISGGPELTPTEWSPTPACLVTLEATPEKLLIRTAEAATNKEHLSLALPPS